MPDVGAEPALDDMHVNLLAEFKKWFANRHPGQSIPADFASLSNLGSLPEENEMDDLGAAPALNEQGVVSGDLLHLINSFTADSMNPGSLPKEKKMTADVGAEPALEDEHDDPRDELKKWFASRYPGQSIPADFASLSNLGSLPEENGMTADVGAEPALEDEHDDPRAEFKKWFANRHPGQSIPADFASLSNLGCLPEENEMTADVGAEPALDDEHDDPRAEFKKWFANRHRCQSIPADFARLSNLGSLPEENEMDDLGAEPALNEQGVVSGDLLHLINYFTADSMNPGSLSKEKKMTADVGAEPALDDEHDDPRDELKKWFANRHRCQSIPADFARLSNLGSLPEENEMADLGAEPALDEQDVVSGESLHLINSFTADRRNPDSLPKEKKDTKTPVKKRKIESKVSPQVAALKEESNKYKEKKRRYTSKVQEKEKEIKVVKSSERVNKKLACIEKDKAILKKHLKSLEKQIDESQEEQLRTLSTELDKIKNNVRKINEKGTEKKDYFISEIKKWERKEEQAKTEMQKSIEEARDGQKKAKEKAEQNIQAAKEWEEINRSVQNIQEAEDREEITIKKNIEARNRTLTEKKDQFAKNIQRMNEEQAKTIAGIDAEIQKLNDEVSKMKEASKCQIAAKRKVLDEFQRKIRKEEHDINKKIKEMEDFEVEEKRKIQKEKENKLKILDEYEKKARDHTKRYREIKDDIKYLKEKKAREENKMKKDFKWLLNSKQKLEESIQAIQQDEAKQSGDIKAEIKTLKEKELQVKTNLDANIKQLQNELAVTTQEIDKKLEVKEQEAAATAMKFRTRIKNMKDKEKQMEKNIKQKEKEIEKIKMDEEQSKDQIASMQQHVARLEFVIANKLKAMQKAEHEETEEYDAIIKNMQELEMRIKKYNIEKSVKALHKKNTLNE